jgi:two-component system sensor histidine kinase RegB
MLATIENDNVSADPKTQTTTTIAEAAFLSTPAITLRWLLRMRWGAVLGQTLTILGTLLLFRLPLPLASLFAIILATAASNVVLQKWMQSARSVSPRSVTAVLAFDTLSLAALLYFTGGPSNPFSVLFLVQITIAALVLGTGTTAAIVALSTAAYAFLFFANVPLAGMEHMHHSGTSAFNLHLQGMFVAFTLAAVLIAYFVTRVSATRRAARGCATARGDQRTTRVALDTGRRSRARIGNSARDDRDRLEGIGACRAAPRECRRAS